MAFCDRYNIREIRYHVFRNTHLLYLMPVDDCHPQDFEPHAWRPVPFGWR